MQQHSVPQNVTAYQFRLIGDMTIKQFIFLSIGIAAAIFFYYTNLFSLIKWFFVLISAMTGFALAFLPLEERPLDQWLINYLRAIYRPTRFIWHKQPEAPKYFSFSSNQTVSPADSQELARAAAIRRQQGLRSYLITLPSDQAGSVVDTQEQEILSGVLGLFNPTSPAVSTDLAEKAGPSLVTTFESPAAAATAPPLPSLVPVSAPIQVDKPAVSVVPATINEPTKSAAQPSSETLTTENVSTPSVAAASNSNLPFPSAPASPNTLVGMVLDSSNKIVDGAIVEVMDETGLPVRATKTNQLGQFFSTTPLKPGIYRLSVEKSGLTFDTIEISLTGEVVGPLKIQAKA